MRPWDFALFHGVGDRVLRGSGLWGGWSGDGLMWLVGAICISGLSVSRSPQRFLCALSLVFLGSELLASFEGAVAAKGQLRLTQAHGIARGRKRYP